MDSTDFVQTYVPAISEIPEADALRVRQNLETFAKTGWPDLDMAPNTPFGDLHLTPLAYLVAGVEMGLRRFMSDLALENPANGITYNCDFVRRFLGNYGIYAQDTLRSSGILRLVFSADAEVTLDRGTKFSIGTNTSTFSLYLPKAGGWTIRQVGGVLDSAQNNTWLIDAGDGSYYADIPVIGDMNAEITAGDAAAISPSVDNLVSIRALADFDKGSPPDSIATLAERARATIYSSSMGSRYSARRFLFKEFPDLVAGSPVISGDSEMLRDSVNALGISDGRMDVFVRSTAANLTETLVVSALYDPTADSYWVKLPSNGTVQKITGVLYNGSTAVSRDDYTVLSVSSNHAKATMGAAAYSTLEQLYLVVGNIKNPSTGDELITSYQSGSARYAQFLVTVVTDPMVPIVAGALENADAAPVGVDVLVRGFVPIDFTAFNVHYAKRAGTTMYMDRARSEILTYMDSLGHPVLYSDSKIVDAMFYAGASDVTELEIRASIRWSAADKFLAADDPTPETDLTGALAAARTPPRVAITSTRSLKPTYRDPALGTATATLVSAGQRNLTYYLPDDALSFTEEYDT